MSDDDLRELERRALESQSDGDRDALLRALERLGDPARLLHWRWRFGLISRRRLQLAGLAGYAPASQALPAEARIPPPAGLREWADELGAFGQRLVLRACIVAARELERALPAEDRLPEESQRGLHALEAWVLDPNPEALGPAWGLTRLRPEWLNRVCVAALFVPVNALRLGRGERPTVDHHVLALEAIAAQLGPERTRRVVDEALLTFALTAEHDAAWASSEAAVFELAVQFGDLARVTELLGDGVPPDVRGPSSQGESALELALSRGHAEVARALLAAGASLGSSPEERERIAALMERVLP